MTAKTAFTVMFFATVMVGSGFSALAFGADQYITVMKRLTSEWVEAPALVYGPECDNPLEPGEIVIDDDQETVDFWRVVGNADHYWIRANKDAGGLGDIKRIEAHCGSVSDFTLYIMGGGGSAPVYGSYGAVNVGPGKTAFDGIYFGLSKNVDIRGQVEGDCHSVQANQSVLYGGGVYMIVKHNISGAWSGKTLVLASTLDGDISADFTFPGPSGGTLEAKKNGVPGNITGSLTLGLFTGNIIAGNLSADTILDDPDIQITSNECVCGVFHGAWKVNGQKPRCILRKATAPDPADSSTGVVVWRKLAWQDTDELVRHRVYLWADGTSPQYQGETLLSVFDPGRLQANTSYHWRVDTVGHNGALQTGDVWSFSTAPEPAMIYVDTTKNGNGSSWPDAYHELQQALAAAQANTEIWVAEGTYKPTDGATDPREGSFALASDVAVYGGFPTGGGDGTFSARAPDSYPTILNGDRKGE